MQHFQPILIAIGILAIAGVLIHGFLLNRKNKLALLAEKDEQLDELEEQDKPANIDDQSKINSFDRDFDAMAFSTHLPDEKEDHGTFDFKIDSKESINQVDPVFYKSEQAIAPEVTDIKLQEESQINDIAALSQADILSSTAVVNPKVAKNPTIVVNPAEIPNPIKETPVELFIFNIAAKNGERLGGHELLQFFLTSGFRYGDMNIFHRHEHSDGTGEILFSIANMMTPGTFDLDYMEQFNSPGISFFFTAPNDKISVNKSFDMMLRAVEQLAEEFDCEVLNEKREQFTTEQFFEYRTRLAKYT